MDMQKMMKQAQKMQAELARAQEEIQSFTYTATVGGGMVSAEALGDGSIQKIEINPEVVDPNDVDMLQDLVLAAVNDAIRGVQEESTNRMSAATGGINIPGLM